MQESETNTSYLKKCFICAQKQPFKRGLANIEIEEKDKIFNLLCKSLKIKLGKKNSWDFKKEALPFCSSCTEVSNELVVIQEEIRTLENRFAEKVEDLRTLIVQSDSSHLQLGQGGRGSRSKKFRSEDSANEENEDERYEHFRRQVTGKKPIPQDSPKPSSSVIIAAIPPKLRLKNQKPATSTRRSTRVAQKTVLRILSDKSDSEDTGMDDKDDDFQDSDYEVSDSKAEKDEADEIDAADLKPVIEIKQEAPSEDEANVPEPDSVTSSKVNESASAAQPTMTSAPIKRNPKRKVKSKTVLLLRKRPRKSVLAAPLPDRESEDESDYRPEKSTAVSDSDEGSSEYDEEDGGKSSWTSVRKWKLDNKTGKLRYDGIEVLLVDKGLKCSICDEVIEGDKKSNNKIKMKRHILLKHLEKYTCVLCDKIMSCKKYLDMHVKMVHEKSVIIPCHVCEKPFTSMNAMRRHAWNHQNEEEKEAAIASGKKQYGGGRKSEALQCVQCGKMCKGPYNLKRHEETHIDHSERLKHMCQICGALYSAPETLRSHIKMAHENNNRLQWLQCPHCPKKYPQPGRLEKHMRCHTGEKPFKCPDCGSGFSQSTLLKVHRLKHNNLRPHKCEHCDMSFFRRYHLQRHTQVYHESETPPTKKQPYRSENGTRKTPQKRTRKKISSIDVVKPGNLEHQLIIPSDQRQPQRTCDTVDAQQLIGMVGNLTEPPHAPPTFNFTSSSSCAYPFSYSFPAGSSGSGLNH